MDKPPFHDDERCKGCVSTYYAYDGRRDKWLCFGITNPVGRKFMSILDYDNLRFCIKHPPRPISEKGLFQLNMSKREAEAFQQGLETLLLGTEHTGSPT